MDERIWQERSGDDVVTLVRTESGTGLAVADDTGSAAIQLTDEQLHSLRGWLVTQLDQP